MKKLIFALVVLFSLSFLYSCTKSDAIQESEESGESGEYIELGLNPKGIDISVESMTKGSSSNDLYYVEVQKDEVRETYAAWVTDDITKDKFKLLKGHKYRFFVMYLPNAKNIIHGDNAAPFEGMHRTCPTLKDGICYGTKYGNQGAMSGAVRKKGDKQTGMPASGYHMNDVVRYHGYTLLDKASSNITLDVNLYRQMFALEIVTKNFTEGTIVINPFDAANMTVNNIYYITPSDGTFSKSLELITMPWFDSCEWSEEAVKNDFTTEIPFTIDYIAPDGKSMTILSYRDYHKRMTKIKISIDIKEILEDIESGLSPKVITDEEWNEIEVK